MKTKKRLREENLWGKYVNPTICDSNNLRNVSVVLCYSKVEIKASDYKQVLLENAKEGDFIYLDPLYNPVSSTAYLQAILIMDFPIRTKKSLRWYTDN
jgi:DNA adenine methylase